MGTIRHGSDHRLCSENVDDWPKKRIERQKNGDLLVRIARTKFGEFDLSDVESIATSFNFPDLLLVSAYSAWSPVGDPENGGGGVGIAALVGASNPELVRRLWGKSHNTLERIASEIPPVITVGISGRWDESLSATRIEARYILPLPRIDLQFYASGGYEWINARGNQSWEPTAGFGVEVGYSLVYFHIGTEVNSALASDGSLTPRVTFRSGVTIMVPRSVYWK